MQSLKFRFAHLFLVSALSVTSLACGSEDSNEFELLGTWDDEFGGKSEITSEKWGVSTLTKYDNEANFAILQSPPDDEYSANKFSKVVWTEPSEDGFFVCWVDFGKDTAAEAEASTNSADSTKPAEGGCGGFPWTKMTRAATDV